MIAGAEADPLDTEVLDDPAAIAAADAGGMLPAVATAAAQVREAATLTAEAELDRLVADGRPRGVVVVGMGGSGIAGDVLAAVAGPGCPVPINTHRGYGLPGWVGAADLVVAVSCSGTTEETLSAADEAVRRGARLLAVGAADSPLAERAAASRAPFVPVPPGRQPRASLWALSTPLVLAANALGLLSGPSRPPAMLEETAARLEELAWQCRPDSESFLNPAKELALAVVGALPMIWGGYGPAGAAAYRFACQLHENARLPAMHGELPEAHHNQVVTFDGHGSRVRLVLLRESGEHPRVAARAEASRDLAVTYGLAVSELWARGESPFERLASLVGLVDYTSVYAGIVLGTDPTSVAPILELKERIAR